MYTNRPGFGRALKKSPLIFLCLAMQFLTASGVSCREQIKPTESETKYLLFQVFIAEPATTAFPSSGTVAKTVQDIVSRIGSTGDKHQKLGFTVGPLAFNQSDDEVRRVIKESFQTAREKNVAVAFHIDDQMFWDKSKELFSDKANIEWLDWKGTLCTGRRLDWGREPYKAPAQMCLNSPAIQSAVGQRARLIATEIKREADALKLAGREELFAGIIGGWESMIGRDFDTDRCVGYHALSNKGFNAKTTPDQCDTERVRIVKEFIEMWTKDLAQSGVGTNKIYSHIAFAEQGLAKAGKLTLTQQAGFAPPEVAFNKYCRPGFSTYPLGDVASQIRVEVAKRGNPAWISAEGTNVVPNGMPGDATMETYLAKMFNHGAVMVNIFSWGIGGEAQKNNMFRRATENDEALSAYRKFLAGNVLKEQQPSATAFSVTKFQQKIQTIQKQIPIWVQKTRRVDQIQPLMLQLDGYIKANRFEEANKLADEILKLTSAN